MNQKDLALSEYNELYFNSTQYDPERQSNGSKGFSVVLFLIVIALTIIVIGGWIYWTQNINKNPTTTKPGLHLQQISDPEKFANPTQSDATGQYCGGFAGKLCPTGYTCKLDGNYPDANGNCAKE